MKLPNAGDVEIDVRKITDYCLNPEHPSGKHKANEPRPVFMTGYVKS
jgi:hypothetical protein